ncbi:MAG: DUF354 domain-containing protein [Candidatus Baldrarchaeota archaeon]
MVTLTKIWIDVLTPKQLLFLTKISKKLEKHGFEAFFTSREYQEVCELIKLKRLNIPIIGKHGGYHLKDKLLASTERILLLIRHIEKIEPDIALSFSSPEAARVAYGLNIPHVCVNDSPHSEAVARLTIPLSKLLFTPKIIPKKVWEKYGIPKQAIIQYRSLDPVAWIKDFQPDQEILNNLKLNLKQPIVVIRPTEAYAAYLRGKISDICPVTIKITQKLLKLLKNKIQIVIIPRYKEQRKILKEKFVENVVVPEHAIDTVSLLYYSSLFIGAGGTMNIEAALLGKPVISCFPGKTTFVERYLVNAKLIYRVKDPEKTVKLASNILQNAEKFLSSHKERALKILNRMEDPAEVIAKELKKRLNKLL